MKASAASASMGGVNCPFSMLGLKVVSNTDAVWFFSDE